MKLLLAGRLDLTDKQLKLIKALGDECTVMSDETARVEEPDVFDAVVCNGLFLYNDVAEFKNLKVVQSTSSGIERLPIQYFDTHGIVWHNAFGVYSVPIAEWAVMSALNLLKNSKDAYERQRLKVWEKDRTQRELNGMTVTVVGVGSVGLECAKRFKAFNTRVIGVDVKKVESPYVDEFCYTDQLNDALKKTDVLVLSCALTDETSNMIGKKQLEKLNPSAILINASRGQVVDEKALIKALVDKRIGGAALDVFESEPLSADSVLWDMPSVIVTPHSSFISDKNKDRLFELIYGNLSEFIRSGYGA